MKVRLFGLLALVAAAMLVPTATASAAEAKLSKNPIPINGHGANGQQFKGQFEVQKFDTQDGKLVAVGHLTGIGRRADGSTVNVDEQNFAIPVSKISDHGGANAAAAAQCRILDLTLGPLHLDLLGLVVDLNQVHLTITAVSGPGNLLGNLLCAVAHLLDPNQQALRLNNALGF